MHAGRILVLLRQYLDQRLAGAPAWLRAAAGTGMIVLALAVVAIAVLTGHFALILVGAILVIGIVRQGVTGIRHSRRRLSADQAYAPLSAREPRTGHVLEPAPPHRDSTAAAATPAAPAEQAQN